MGADEIRAYLSHLAIQRHVAPSTQTVALSALLFLYRQVLQIELPYIDNIERAKKPERLPVVFSRSEVKKTLAHLDGVEHLIVSLLYGSGLRLREAMQRRDSKASGLSYLPPQLCHSSATKWLRHSHSAGAIGPQGCENHNDLHPCAQPRWAGGEKPVGLSYL